MIKIKNREFIFTCDICGHSEHDITEVEDVAKHNATYRYTLKCGNCGKEESIVSNEY